jgi:hypothetical protein
MYPIPLTSSPGLGWMLDFPDCSTTPAAPPGVSLSLFFFNDNCLGGFAGTPFGQFLLHFKTFSSLWFTA